MKELIKELEYNEKINKDDLEKTVQLWYIINRLKDISKNEDNKIIELIQNKIEDLEERINTTGNEQMIKEYCIRRLELIWLLDDIKEVLKDA